MALRSETDESDGISGIIFADLSKKKVEDLDKNMIKSTAYWKSKDVPKNDNERKKYCCVVQGCTANFSRPWRLKAHLSLHFGKKPFLCDVKDCDKGYTSMFHLRRHKANVHDKLNISSTVFKCEFSGCMAEFKTVQNARKHFRRTHEGRTCKECGRIFTKRIQLVAHQFEHTGVFPFKCSICDSGFLRKGELRRHERVHREHLCPEKDCFLAFKTWNEVRKHLVTHPKNYVCILCRKSYICRKSLKDHIVKHTETVDTSKKKTVLNKYQCEHCEALLVGKASLRRHISVIHEGKRGQGKYDPNGKKNKPCSRKDKGSVKKSMASILTGIKVPIMAEKKLLQRDELTSDDELVKIIFQDVVKQHQDDSEDSVVKEPITP